MSSAFRRYEILLPLKFNDGSPIPDDLIGETILELRQKFGAVSCETQTIRGVWHHQGQEFRDDLVRVFVDVVESPETREFFVRFKAQILARFQQLDIWMTTYPIEVI